MYYYEIIKSSHSMLFPELKRTVNHLKLESISDARKIVLRPLVNYIKLKLANELEIRLNFICTHNSRRSHLSQIWAQTLAYHFNITNVFCYSGGTESTSLFPMVAETLKSQGFKTHLLSEGVNPIHAIKYAENQHPIIGYSKKFDEDFNPRSAFAAIMTCSEADGSCPFIEGAESRIPITFEDPKKFDDTPQQAQKYNERSLQIATELFYVFSQINS